MLLSGQIYLLFSKFLFMKKTILFKVAAIRHEGKSWKFYPCDCAAPIVFKDTLLNRERIPTAGQKVCKMYIEVDGDVISSLRVDYYNLWELPKKGNRNDAPVLPEAYRVTGSECSRKKHNDSDCCSCCPWCQHITPAGYMKLDYPSECYTFRAKTQK